MNCAALVERFDEISDLSLSAQAKLLRAIQDETSSDHHCHIVTIRGNSYRMRQPTDLWHALHATQEPEAAPNRRRRARQEAATN